MNGACRALCLFSIVLALSSDVVLAQGRSGQPPGKLKLPHPGGGSSTSAPGNPSPQLTPLASWLDDASSLRPGEAWLGLSAARWTSDAARVWFVPSSLIMAGLTKRVGAGVSVPAYHLQDSSGATAHGVSDITVFGKVALIDPEMHALGLAFTPAVIIVPDPAAGERNAAWAFPVSLESRARWGRVYGSAGLVSTGSRFLSSAVEVRLTPALALGGTLGAAFARADETAVSAHRVDTSGSVLLTATERLSLSVSLGHSFSGQPALDGGPWFALGAAFQALKGKGQRSEVRSRAEVKGRR